MYSFIRKRNGSKQSGYEKRVFVYQFFVSAPKEKDFVCCNICFFLYLRTVKGMNVMTKARLCDIYEANWFDKNHLGFVNLFAYALLPHTRTECEELALSKPKESPNGLWPRPWLYLWTMILFAIAFVSLYACWRLEGRADASTLLPGMVIMGSLAMPITLLVLFWEVNKWRTLPLLDVLRYFLIGSCAAIVITFGLQYAFDYCPDYRIIWMPVATISPYGFCLTSESCRWYSIH